MIPSKRWIVITEIKISLTNEIITMWTGHFEWGQQEQKNCNIFTIIRNYFNWYWILNQTDFAYLVYSVMKSRLVSTMIYSYGSFLDFFVSLFYLDNLSFFFKNNFTKCTNNLMKCVIFRTNTKILYFNRVIKWFINNVKIINNIITIQYV